MITNYDREIGVSMTKIWIRDSEGNQLEEIAGIIARIRSESAEQARKEAADSAMAFYARDCEGCKPRQAEDCNERCPHIAELRAAILGDGNPCR